MGTGEGVEVVELDRLEAVAGAAGRPAVDDRGEPVPLPRGADVEQPLLPGAVHDRPSSAVQDQVVVVAPEAQLAGLGLEAVDVADVVVPGQRRRGAITYDDPDIARHVPYAAELVVEAGAGRQRVHRRGHGRGVGEERRGEDSEHDDQPGAEERAHHTINASVVP